MSGLKLVLFISTLVVLPPLAYLGNLLVLKFTLAQTVLLALILFSLFFKNRIGKNEINNKSYLKTFLNIALIQILFYGFLFAISVEIFSLVKPELSAYMQSNIHLTTFVGSLLLQGLHPWVFITIITCVLIASRSAVGHPKLSLMTQVFDSISINPTLLSAIDIASMLSVYFLLTVACNIAVFSSIAILHEIVPHIKFIPYSAGMVMPIVVAIVIQMGDSWQSKVNRTTAKQKSLVGVLLQAILLPTAFLICSSILYLTLSNEAFHQIMNPQFVPTTNPQSLEFQWMIIFWSLGVLFVPILSIYFTEILKGYSIRVVVLLLLAMPTTTAILIESLSLKHAQELTNFFTECYVNPHIHWFVMGLICSIFYYLYRSALINDLLVHMTPNLAGKNMRRLRRIYIKLAPIIWIVFLSQITLGVHILQFLSLLFALGCLFYILLPGTIAYFRIILKK